MDLFDIKGKVAVITGVTSPLGESMAEALAAYGCNIIIPARDKAKGTDLTRILSQKYGLESTVLLWDALDVESIKKLAIDAKAWKGRVDILINNAGGSQNTSSRHFFDRSDKDIRDTIGINLLCTLYCCREFGRIMKEQKSGKIINIASIAGIVGRDRRIYKEAGLEEQLLDYAAAKGGVISLTRDLAAMLAPYGVYANSISPGGFRHRTTDLFAKLYGDKTALGYMGRTETDLQGAVLFLASGASDYVVGHNLVVDGGFTVWK
jgi:gluconate 5-dehydrogenase